MPNLILGSCFLNITFYERAQNCNIFLFLKHIFTLSMFQFYSTTVFMAILHMLGNFPQVSNSHLTFLVFFCLP